MTDIESSIPTPTYTDEELTLLDEYRNIPARKTITIVMLIVISLPFIMYDLYFAITDKSCVNQKCNDFNLTMHDYLVVNAIMDTIVLSVSISIISHTNDLAAWSQFIKFCAFIIVIFCMIWAIVGALIFWRFMDNEKCDDSVFDYLGIRLIIMLICNSFIFVIEVR